MERNFQPQGLYHPDFEHDACGIGMYAHIKGKATHEIVEKKDYTCFVKWSIVADKAATRKLETVLVSCCKFLMNT
ncbi:hypothetical protein GCM10020331_062840 [Ectobacillus funiculus]